MRITRYHVTSVILLLISLSIVTGCSNRENVSVNNEDSIKKMTGYPLETNEVLTCWLPYGGNLGETNFAQELEKKTGVKVEYTHASQAQISEQFNLMIASREFPDIVEYNWNEFQGGASRAIADKVVMPLNDLIKNYSPNLKAYIENNSKLDKLLQTDKGEYFVYPFIRGDDFLTTYYGPMMRKDWLDDLKLDIPETIDDWENVLKAFKTNKGAEAPLMLLADDNNWNMHNGFVGAFGISNDFYVENGKVKYGPMQNQYKDFLGTMSRWYKEGLLDKNYGNSDSKIISANILGGKTGATLGYLGSGMGKLLSSAQDPKFDLVGVPYPVVNSGQKPKFGQKDLPFTGVGAAIMSTTKKPVLAAKFLDYAYSTEGHMLYNFGIEGITYETKEEYPHYTDLILNNPDGLSISSVMTKYFRASYGGPFVQDKRYMEQYLKTKQQKDAIKTWMNTDAEEYALPLLSLTQEENTQFTNIMADIKTYKEEMVLKFIIGVEPIEKIDVFIEQIKAMGINNAINIKQKALERYNNIK